MKNAYFSDLLGSYCKRYEVQPKQVILEIVEDIDLQSDTLRDQLRELKKLGFLIAIDDFGTKQSNFSRWLSIEPNFLKIDGAFIKDISTNEQHQKIVKSIQYFATQMGCYTVAEFVHDAATHDMVKKLGIHYSQGYFISEPRMKPYEEKAI